MNSDDTSKIGEEALSQQRARLDQLVTWEHEIEVLKELESDLEVEQISADVALRAATSKHDFAIAPTDAEEIARTRARKRELEAALQSAQDESAPTAADLSAALERIRAGREALESWRDAPKTVAAWRRPRVANTVLIIAIACAAALWAAIALHPVYLVLLVPLIMAIGYLTLTAQDAEWVRLGAVRRFQNTRLKPPTSWEQRPVDGRIAELDDAASETEQQLARIEAGKDEASEHEDKAASELALSVDLVAASDDYAAAVARAGLDADAVDAELSRWLDLVYESHRIGSELKQIKAKRVSLGREAEEARDALFRFLVLADEAPPEGRADSEALRAGLERVAKRAS